MSYPTCGVAKEKLKKMKEKNTINTKRVGGINKVHILTRITKYISNILRDHHHNVQTFTQLFSLSNIKFKVTIAIIYKVQLLIGFTKTKSNMTSTTIYFHLGARMSTNYRCQIGLGQHKFNTEMQELGC